MTKLECLIVDDDELKRDRIKQTINGEVGEGNVRVTTVGSANETIDLLRATQYDLLVIDVNLPIRAGEPPSKEGGIKLLKQISRGTGGLIRPAFVVGVTAYPELAASALSEFSAHGWALLTYSPESSVWENALANHCQHIYSYKAKLDSASKAHGADICIVTALSETELEAVSKLPCGFKTVTHPLDQSRYFEGQISSTGRPLRIVATAASEMGNAATAVTASKVIALFRPKVCFLVGICAGIDADIGDLAIADFSLHYESGKYNEGEEGETIFLPQPRYQPASERLLEAVKRFKLDHGDKILGLPASWPADKPSKAPLVHFGPVASGAAVVENKEIVTNLKFRDRKLIALEMESYGFYLACRTSTQPKTEYVMIKAVCDKAKPPKMDKYQHYCAFLSANFTYQFLLAEAAIPGGLFS
ncbi:phosphorylase family protein [Tuwongella immobilis]|uniref:Response regulatory domain-containing protein n=1 Tax=Tuwongella immobilis TaxID=692036 RepID=A0A6C2YSP6_9BACT|nr:response regulator [Tuwongella immobilis]VIP04394.1 response regulator receiver protein : Purine or other phosphorylase family 1 OS=Planctomyces limnophilus (strain ATCC 43296 / DSM 3776 / IFAM 1008 / 290) GN=Plim_1101 PE=4 SV=1: Response_reg: PNP_UDP_1 [Tuwongella immobilis]VTS06150.1 response regulator receiver protein : Purine or other phosphorylase family 1 OS=Planctomyces limnophilus (strain ATCC 43296 / DSM 3776 / IFAM 1008 / 290) GN=Plim_1101 PE=4 SV=1: Response_reg: PNP_UDP_1 [Tuwongel